MFTGIVEAIGKVVRVGAAPRAGEDGAQAYRLAVHVPELLDDLALGASVAVNGVCLTLVEHGHGASSFDVVPETWRNTTLRTLRTGDAVNLERSLRVGDRIDGHFVQGHVDGTGRVERLDRTRGECKLWVAADAALMPCIVRKGSVALDGTSLTIVDTTSSSFSVALIPATLERTVLGKRAPGDLINIETDILARLVISRLNAGGADRSASEGGGGLTLEALSEGGFL